MSHFTGYMIDIPKAIKDNANSEDLEKYVSEVLIYLGLYSDPKKMLVVSDEGEFNVDISQLNKTTYHVEKSFAQDELDMFIKINSYKQ